MAVSEGSSSEEDYRLCIMLAVSMILLRRRASQSSLRCSSVDMLNILKVT